MEGDREDIGHLDGEIGTEALDKLDKLLFGRFSHERRGPKKRRRFSSNLPLKKEEKNSQRNGFGFIVNKTLRSQLLRIA